MTHVRSEAAQPGLVWEKESLEFKPVPGTKGVVGAFHFVNRSQGSVNFSRVTPNCGCLKVTKYPQETGPGGEGDVEFWYDAADKEGVQTARIEIQSEGAVKMLQTLRIQLELSPRVFIRPGLLIWGKSAGVKEVVIRVVDSGLILDEKVTFAGDFSGKIVPGKTQGEFILQLERASVSSRAEGWATLTFRSGSEPSFERKIRLIAD